MCSSPKREHSNSPGPGTGSGVAQAWHLQAIKSRRPAARQTSSATQNQQIRNSTAKMDYSYGNNQYSTSYGGQGAADGGGFVGGDTTSSPAGGKGGYGKDTVRPVTIKQVIDAQQPHPDADFRIDGDGISQITFVGQVRSISTQTTNITYKVDDGTGVVEVKQWIDGEASNDHMELNDPSKPKLVENGYCRVWGRLKQFNNKRHVGAHVIRPITDMDEINYHLLEATAVHLFFTRGPPPDGTTGRNGAGADGGAVGGAQEMAANGRAMPSVTPMARRVYNLLKDSPQSNEGLHVQMLASQLNAGVNDVYKAAEELVHVGLIFTTVDDQTWAILDY